MSAVIGSGHPDESEVLKLRILRAQLWIETGNPRRALEEIADLERDSRLSDEVRAMLADLKH